MLLLALASWSVVFAPLTGPTMLIGLDVGPQVFWPYNFVQQSVVDVSHCGGLDFLHGFEEECCLQMDGIFDHLLPEMTYTLAGDENGPCICFEQNHLDQFGNKEHLVRLCRVVFVVGFRHFGRFVAVPIVVWKMIEYFVH